MMRKYLQAAIVALIAVFCQGSTLAQYLSIEKVEPPNWWVGTNTTFGILNPLLCFLYWFFQINLFCIKIYFTKKSFLKYNN